MKWRDASEDTRKRNKATIIAVIVAWFAGVLAAVLQALGVLHK